METQSKPVGGGGDGCLHGAVPIRLRWRRLDRAGRAGREPGTPNKPVISEQYTVGKPVNTTLPAATGGNALTYSLMPTHFISRGDLSMSTKHLTNSLAMGLLVAPPNAAERVRSAVRLTLAALALLVAAPLDAQGPVRQGERVRASTLEGAQFVGVVTQIDTESLRLQPDGSTVPLNLALAEIQGLERSIGQGHHGRKWGTYGAIAGGGIGVLSGLTWWGRGEGGNQVATVAYLGVVNAIWMGGAGYAAGYFLGKYDIWQNVQLGRSEQQGLGLVFGIGPAAGGTRSSPVLIGVRVPWG